MSEINLYQYAEIKRPGAQPEIIGSKNKPTTITLTGTGEVYHRVWNDASVFPLDIYVNDDFSQPFKFFAVKCSVDAILGWNTDTTVGSTNTIKIEANTWQFFTNGVSTKYNASLQTRAAEAEEDIGDMTLYVSSGTADVEFIAAY